MSSPPFSASRNDLPASAAVFSPSANPLSPRSGIDYESPLATNGTGRISTGRISTSFSRAERREKNKDVRRKAQLAFEERIRRIEIPPFPPKSNYRTYILSDAIFEAECRYRLTELIGHGAYGVVTSGNDQMTGQQVAIKKIYNIFEHRSLAKRTLREIKLLRYLKHENIMSLDRVLWPSSRNFDSVYLCCELMETDLACVVRSNQELSSEHCQFFIYQVLRGLKYIHTAKVIHRDLKPRNLLVNSNCDLKVCDFGLARLTSARPDHTSFSNYVATRWYRAPEVILSKGKYTDKVDMWAVGCILAELFSRKPLFPGRDSFHQISLIISTLGSPEPNSDKQFQQPELVAALPFKPKILFSELFPDHPPSAWDMLDKLLTFDPDDRMTVEEALKHPYLEELHCEEDEPACPALDPEDFEWETAKVKREHLRLLIHDEICSNYPNELYEDEDPPEQFAATLLKRSSPSVASDRRKSF